MPFSVDDFEDLLRLLYERPDWRNRLRELILPPELFELPRIAQELAEVNRAERERVAKLELEQQATRQELQQGFAETGARFDRVDGRLDRVDGRLDRVDGRLDRVEGRLEHVETDLAAFRSETAARFEQVDQRFDGIDQQLGGMSQRLVRADQRAQRTNTDIGILKGNSVEERFRGRATFFSDLVPRPVVLTISEFDAFVADEIATGRLLPVEGRRVLRTDLLVRGGEPANPTYLVVEVSWSVDVSDVQRAAERAGLLRKAGHQARGAVAGWRIQREALDLAERLDVGRVIERELDGEDPAGGDDEQH